MDLMCTALDVDMSDSEIKECIRIMIPVCIQKQQGFCLTINGFDYDHRELWQIPEAVSFMKRTCEFGLISALEVSTTCKDLIREEYNLSKLPGFGAIEVWMCATARMANGANGLDLNTLSSFYSDLDAANKAAEMILNESLEIPDSQIKHKGFDFLKTWNRR